MLKDFIVRYTEYHLPVLGGGVVFLVLGFRGGVASVFTDVIGPRLAAQRRWEGQT